MLRKETVTPATLELLNTLMQDKQLADFTLVGGTALALQIGHRFSIDIDLFNKQGFDPMELGDHLKSSYGFKQEFTAKNTLKGEVNGVKLDIITHNYPDVAAPLHVENVRMASPQDIAAMKLNAIIGNGTRIKDFVDVAYLSAEMPLREMLESYSTKYSQSNNPAMALKAINFHQDVNFIEPVQLLKGKFYWEKIVDRLKEMSLSPDKKFPLLNMPEPRTRTAPKINRSKGL
jgi:hypothetical protein